MANSKMTAVNGGSFRVSDIGLLANNLMNALAAKFVLLRKIRKAQPALMVRTDAGVPGSVRRRARAERTPLPTRDCLEQLLPLDRKKTSLATLSDIADEAPQLDLDTFEDLDVNCRDSAVPFPRPELLQGSQVHVESHSVVHGAYNSRNDFESHASRQKFHLTTIMPTLRWWKGSL